MDSVPIIYVVEEHDQVLDLWKSQKVSSLRILHLDAHCDMRGLLVDRQAQLAYRIWDKNPGVDPGNFLTHAIFEGRISSLRWVYNEPGGRENDVGTVKYESDLTSLPYRCLIALKNAHGLPIQFEVIPYTNWTGINDGEYLDIDWDFFAHTAYPKVAIQEHVDAFLRTEFRVIPEQIYVCYSPDFSQPSRVEFGNFVENLAKLFNADVIYKEKDRGLPAMKYPYKKFFPIALTRLIRRGYYKASLRLRKWGIY